MTRQYLCIDIKSFFASAECVERGLDPMTTDLIVADPTRTEKTICLAVSPSLKAKGVRNRCRVFEIPKGLTFLTAPPRMQLYIRYSANVYTRYLQYVSSEDIHVYSIDEAFLDVTHYLAMYRMTAEELARYILADLWENTGLPASCGIGTNLYLAKIALDITAKHTPDRIGQLTEESYRETLWDHRPLTDFWRIGPGTAARLAQCGITTMRQLAYAYEDRLYRLFGVDAELLIDHAWGREPTTIADIHTYQPKTTCLSRGQVLPCPYPFDKARLVLQEMTDALSLELVERGQAAGAVMLSVSYGRQAPPSCRTLSLDSPTSSTRRLTEHTLLLFDRITDRSLPIRQLNLTFQRLAEESGQQLDLFHDAEAEEREKQLQKTLLSIRKRYGKAAVFKGMDLEEGATALERFGQIGGHHA